MILSSAHADRTCDAELRANDNLLTEANTWPSAQQLAQSSEAERLRLALRYVEVAGRELRRQQDEVAALKKADKVERAFPENARLAYFSLIDQFRLSSMSSTIALAEGLLRVDHLYTTHGNDVVLFGTGADGLERFFRVARQWPEADRRRVALNFVDQARTAKLVYLIDLSRAFNIPDSATVRELRVGVLKTYIKRWGEKYRFELMRTQFLNSGMSTNVWDMVRWSISYENFSKHVTFEEFKLSVHALARNNAIELATFFLQPEVQRVLLVQYGTEYVAAAIEQPHFEDLPVRAAARTPLEPTLPGAMQDFSNMHPGVIPPALLSALAEGTGDQETYIFLLNAAFNHLPEIARAGALDFNQLLTYVFPWPRAQMEKWSKQGRWDILALAAQLFNTTGKSLFDYLPLDTENFPDSADLAELMEMVRNNYQLVPAYARKVTKHNKKPQIEALKSTVKDLFSDERGQLIPVSAANVRHFITESRAKFNAKVGEIFKDGGGGRALTFDDLRELGWNDIEPVLTLYTRLEQKTTREVVRDVLNHSLDHTFDAYKFDAPEARPQVEFLTAAELEAWKRPRVKVASAGGEARRQQLRAASVEIAALVAEDLSPKLNSFIEGAIPPDPVALGRLVADLSRANPFPIVEAYLGARPERARAAGELLAAAHAGLLGAETPVETKRHLARIAGVLVNKIYGPKLGEQKDDVIQSLKQIERMVPKDEDPELEAKGLIVSVVDHSPRLMMTLGDLVQTKSCQSYSTGKKIPTLPAYVIDANVQAVASFHVGARHFHKRAEYRALLRDLDRGALERVEFLGNKRILRFYLSDDRVVETSYLGFAVTRQVLKLGYVDRPERRRAAIRLETEYFQNSEYLAVMRRHHAEFKRELVHDLHAVQDERMTVPASRNPEGVYSDLAIATGVGHNGKTHVKAYQFEPDTKEDHE